GEATGLAQHRRSERALELLTRQRAPEDGLHRRERRRERVGAGRTEQRAAHVEQRALGALDAHARRPAAEALLPEDAVVALHLRRARAKAITDVAPRGGPAELAHAALVVRVDDGAR